VLLDLVGLRRRELPDSLGRNPISDNARLVVAENDVFEADVWEGCCLRIKEPEHSESYQRDPKPWTRADGDIDVYFCGDVRFGADRHMSLSFL